MIRLELPCLPPSTNHAYVNNGFGGRKLSAGARAFLTETKAHLAHTYPREMMIFRPNVPYLLVMRFHFEAIENANWGRSGKGKTRYKKVDATNRIKLLEDALADAGGIDDSQFVSTTPQKVQGIPERTILWVWSLEEESSPTYETIQRLT